MLACQSMVKYDFEFALYDVQAGGTEVAGPVNIDDLAVTEGEFTAEIDFGLGVFGGANQWLEIRVREGASTNPHTILTPRQRLTPSPSAHHAFNVEDGAISLDQIAPGAVASLQIVDGSIVASDVDLSQLQARVTGTCNPGEYVSAVNQDGTVNCEPDTRLRR